MEGATSTKEGVVAVKSRGRKKAPATQSKQGKSLDWDAIKTEYLTRNLGLPPGEPDYTLRELAEDIGVSERTVKDHATRGSVSWYQQMQAMRRRRAYEGEDAAREQATLDERSIRAHQVRQYDLAEQIAALALSRVLTRMQSDPNFIPRPEQLRAYDRLLRTSQDGKRAALGLPKIVELKTRMADDGPLAHFEDHEKVGEVAAELAAHLEAGGLLS